MCIPSAIGFVPAETVMVSYMLYDKEGFSLLGFVSTISSSDGFNSSGVSFGGLVGTVFALLGS